MKAFTTLGDGIDGLKLNELPVPEPKAGEILVKMRAASLNYRDLLVVNGIESWKPISTSHSDFGWRRRSGFRWQQRFALESRRPRGWFISA
jgi:NADPH:quinone reductase-like Zn-dependent oxidoreductase